MEGIGKSSSIQENYRLDRLRLLYKFKLGNFNSRDYLRFSPAAIFVD